MGDRLRNASSGASQAASLIYVQKSWKDSSSSKGIVFSGFTSLPDCFAGVIAA